MKKSLIYLILCLLVVPLIVAQTDLPDSAGPDSSGGSGPTEEEIEEGLQDIGDALQDARNPLTSSFENEIELPEWLQFPAKVVFGIPQGETISVEELIILISTWALFIVVLMSILELTPFFHNKILNIIGAIIITALIQMTGAIKMLIDWLLDFIDFILWFETVGWVDVLLGILIAVIIVYLSRRVSSFLNKKVRIEKAKQRGNSINTATKIAKIQTKHLK